MSTAIDLESALDEVHAAVLGMLPPDLLDLTDIGVARARIDAVLGAMPAAPLPDGIEITEQTVPGYDGAPDVRVKLYRPAVMKTGGAALLWIHGGGMVLLSADGDDAKCAMVADAHQCMVVSVDYRLAPESPAPAALHDCYAALQWLAASANDLGVDAERIVIGGASAGGGLAAGTALLARDKGGPALAAQLLIYPMIDHSNTTGSSHRIADTRVWNREANLSAWDAYLGGQAPTIYSSPSTATDLAGLPPAYINVGTLDMFMDEDIAYAQALTGAGVPVELHVYPGAFHGSNGFVADHPLSVRWHEDEQAFLARALASDA